MRLPAVLLHDHLDGGLRPQTVIDLAAETGYSDLPTRDPHALANWFDQSESGSLKAYLEAFTHTIGVMQTPPALERVAYEAIVDLAADGVVYAEIRFSPPLHTEDGLSPAQVIQSVAKGLEAGREETGLEWRVIIDALRHAHNSYDIAKLATESMEYGVVAFDLAGPEEGYPPEDHAAACRLALESGLRLTIHAGEDAGVHGVEYIASAVERCGAERIGHGVQIIEDCSVEDNEIVHMGPVAERIRSRRTALELCPASNLATGSWDAMGHPLGLLYRAGFNVTINTDNRLMSSTAMSKEFDFAQSQHGFSVEDLATVTRNSLEAAFCDDDTKKHLWENVIGPSYAEAGADVRLAWR